MPYGTGNLLLKTSQKQDVLIIKLMLQTLYPMRRRHSTCYRASPLAWACGGAGLGRLVAGVGGVQG